MKSKIKIRTMKDDLASANDSDKKEELTEAKQDQNKPNIATAGMVGSNAMPNTAPSKLKDEEVSELKNLIEKISTDSDKKDLEKKDVKKEDVVMDIADEKTIDKQQKQAGLKTDEKKELKNLIDKISETIEKEEDKTVPTESSDDKLEEKKEDETEKTGENKESFWSDVSRNLKDNKLAEPQKINAIEGKNQPITKNIEGIKSVSEESKKEEYGNSGVLIKDKREETLPQPLSPKKQGTARGELVEDAKEKKEIRKNFHDDANYQPPENRLIFGKQKKYSSVSKRIELKEKKDEIENMRNTDEIKEKQQVISEKEKYAKLKNRVIKKYNIKLFLLPWKKIIPIAIILIVLSGAIYYTLVKEFTVTPPNPPTVIIGTEIEEFAKIRNTIEFTKDDIVKMGFKENAINERFMDNKVEELRIIIKDNDNIIPLKKALESVKIETGDFPNSFWETTTESYNIFAVKTEQNAFRFAIAIESNDIASLLKTMGDWEQENVDKRKIFNVFEPFFTDSKIEENFDQHFESTNYEYIYIRYINLPDKNTSFDYFAKDGLLIIATSKENTERIIDILNSDNDYDSYEN